MAARSGGRDVIVGLVLAGGRSSRMGEDKAGLVIDGVTMLERTSAMLRASGATTVAVSGDRHGGIPDRWPDTGPIGGIASAALSLPDGDWLVVPVDMPRLGDAVLGPLLAERARAVTHWRHHPLPMRLSMNDSTRAVLADLVTRPGRECSVAALQARLGAITLALDGFDTNLLINCNTPDDWREANA